LAFLVKAITITDPKMLGLADVLKLLITCASLCCTLCWFQTFCS